MCAVVFTPLEVGERGRNCVRLRPEGPMRMLFSWDWLTWLGVVADGRSWEVLCLGVGGECRIEVEEGESW